MFSQFYELLDVFYLIVIFNFVIWSGAKTIDDLIKFDLSSRALHLWILLIWIYFEITYLFNNVIVAKQKLIFWLFVICSIVISRLENSASCFLRQPHFEARGNLIFNVFFFDGYSGVLVRPATILMSGYLMNFSSNTSIFGPKLTLNLH